jgi:hypothetical protein
LLSPQRKKDFGLTDGEMLEQPWTYIRGFGKMTKEMRLSHRIDVLTDALLHYGKRTSDKIGMFKNVCSGHACTFEPIISLTVVWRFSPSRGLVTVTVL